MKFLRYINVDNFSKSELDKFIVGEIWIPKEQGVREDICRILILKKFY